MHCILADTSLWKANYILGLKGIIHFDLGVGLAQRGILLVTFLGLIKCS